MWVHNADCCEIGKRVNNSVDKTIKNAANNKISYASNYHGRLNKELELDILQNPKSVYLADNGNFVFCKNGNIVVTNGVGSSRGKLITSYGKDGPRGESGKTIYGGSASDPGIPITQSMIENGEIPTPNGGFLSPAKKVR